MPLFIQEFFAFLLGKETAALVKKRAQKALVKSIKSNQFRHFYKPKKGELTATAARYFFEVYRLAAGVQLGWKGAAGAPGFRDAVIRYFIPREILDLLDGLDEKTLRQRMEERGVQETVRMARDGFQAFVDAIDQNLIDEINNCCTQALYFEYFAAFDYYALLKKFGSIFNEYQVTPTPSFYPVKGKAVSEALKDFLYISLPLSENTRGSPEYDERNWTVIFRFFKAWSGADAASVEHWLKLLKEIQSVNLSQIFELVIRHLEEDPDWKVKWPQNKESVFSPWLKARRRDLKDTLNGLARVQWNNQAHQLVSKVFGGNPGKFLKYYTEDAGEPFVDQGFIGFIHAEGINCLMAFINDFDQEMREICELIMIRGLWTTSSLPKAVLEQSRLTLELGKKILEFDESMRDDGIWESGLFEALRKTSADQSAARSVQDSLILVNDEAKKMLVEGSQIFAKIQHSLEDIGKDYDAPTRSLILNWQELEQAVLTPLETWFDASSIKLGTFIEMINFFIQDSASVNF